MFIIRDAQDRDLDHLYQVATELNSVNLPADRAVIAALIERSQASLRDECALKRRLLFVLEEWAQVGGGWRSEVFGCAMIIAQHGTHDRPASYFRIMERQKYSPILKKHFKHQTLELIFDYDGPTELGGLVLSSRLRGHPLKLGRFLSYVRLAFIGLPSRRGWFEDEVVAELLPALGPDRQSELWPYLGQRFTGLDYHTADQLSREHIHFVHELFPQAPLYTALLPPHVQAQLGKVGPASQPAAHLLAQVGFEYDGTIDPFDGGPTYRVRTDECALIRGAVRGEWVSMSLTQSAAARPGILLLDGLSEGRGLKALLGEGVRGVEGAPIEFRPFGSDEAREALLSADVGREASFTPFP
jgi:arginine N-succinyltransferase